MMLFYLISRPSLDLSHQSPPSDLSPWFLLVWSRAVVSLCRTVWSVTSGSSRRAGVQCSRWDVYPENRSLGSALRTDWAFYLTTT